MTAIATIGALLPLALGFEGGSQVISKGLGVTVIGGLISSTLLTLLIVPIVYEVLAKFRKKNLERKKSKTAWLLKRSLFFWKFLYILLRFSQVIV